MSPNAVKNLGFRYSVSLWNEAKIKAEPVDADRVFHKGECFLLNFEANRSGYLYVLAKQSDGTWMPLVPNPQMPDEKNVVDPGQKMRIPSEYCFKVEDRPGSETLFVVLSRDPRDVYDLNEAIKSSRAAARRLLREAVRSRCRLRVPGSPRPWMRSQQFNGTRNLSFQKTSEQPQDPQEIAVLEVCGEFRRSGRCRRWSRRSRSSTDKPRKEKGQATDPRGVKGAPWDAPVPTDGNCLAVQPSTLSLSTSGSG